MSKTEKCLKNKSFWHTIPPSTHFKGKSSLNEMSDFWTCENKSFSLFFYASFSNASILDGYIGIKVEVRNKAKPSIPNKAYMNLFWTHIELGNPFSSTCILI